MREMYVTVAKGVVGVVAPAGGVYVSILPQVEAWLRVASLSAGIAVACVTIWSIIYKARKK